MPDAGNRLLRLDGCDSTLLLGSHAGRQFALLYWGDRLPDDACAEQLVMALERQVPHGVLDQQEPAFRRVLIRRTVRTVPVRAGRDVRPLAAERRQIPLAFCGVPRGHQAGQEQCQHEPPCEMGKHATAPLGPANQ